MEIEELRGQMDRINREMLSLFKERMDVSAKIADIKMQKSLPVYDPARERNILSSISEQAGPGMDDYARVLFQTLFDLSRSYQSGRNAKNNALAEKIEAAKDSTPEIFAKRALVACQGIEGAYSQHAADKLFTTPEIMYCKSFEGVFQAVSMGPCEYGVLPIENSSFGSVTAVYDLMRDHRLHIARSMKLHVEHSLLVKPGTKKEEIREIFSHSQAIGQCSKYLAGMPHVKITAVENTAVAAKACAESDRKDVASISSRSCASVYGLEALEDHIQDCGNNYTRFICVTEDLQIYPGANRMSIMFALPHKSGALYRVIARFAAIGLNIVKIESRPIPGRDFEFMFYLDAAASVWQPEVVKLLCDLDAECEFFRFLGNYSEV